VQLSAGSRALLLTIRSAKKLGAVAIKLFSTCNGECIHIQGGATCVRHIRQLSSYYLLLMRVDLTTSKLNSISSANSSMPWRVTGQLFAQRTALVFVGGKMHKSIVYCLVRPSIIISRRTCRW
jgi:hypothetical protein